MVLEEEVGLEEGEDHVHDGDEHVERPEALHPVLVLKHLRDAESVQDHRARAEACGERRRRVYDVSSIRLGRLDRMSAIRGNFGAQKRKEMFVSYFTQLGKLGKLRKSAP